ncbi:hypothetical protein DY000_02040706 [Brassica cretica]|uniref:Uncharacterized protein n=1 Tax=Brassica cretica TaxID=69181 RepID=A0ABQ7BS79_BRACR|nr:hypothetical protein DY000_02040706 [Brassica cretica]
MLRYQMVQAGSWVAQMVVGGSNRINQRCDLLVDMIKLIPLDILDGLKGSDLVQKGMRKELLEFECKMLQIRQVCVNEDPLDPMVAGAWNELV